MQLYFWLSYVLQWIVSAPLLVVEVIALVDAISRSGSMYEAYGKKSKQFWLILLAIGAVFGIIGLPIIPSSSNMFLTIIAVIPAGVYLADVRPLIRDGRW